MGPRSLNRGNPNIAYLLNYLDTLQWGRGLSTAEI